MTRVAYLGPPDTFTHMAALRHFGRRASYVDVPSLDDVFAQVETGACNCGVVPVENSIEGAVTHTLDLFRTSPVVINGEILLPVRHSLVSKGRRTQITTVFSHPQALGQCRKWLARHLPEAYRWETRSTAEAVELAARLGRIDVPVTQRAAIATLAAARRHGLRVLASGIEDHRHNMTRFLVIGRRPAEHRAQPLRSGRRPRSRGGRWKTSVLCALKDKPGALHDALMPFKRHRINLTKIESRPSKMKAWEYFFFIDVDGQAQAPRVARALRELQHHCTAFRVLGTYRSAAGGA